MSTELVENSWDRIDSWLDRHAPRTLASLRAPAAEEDIRAAEGELGLVFPPDLRASLRRHDGATGDREAFRFPTHDRLLGLREIAGMTADLRGFAADLDEEAAACYWHQGYAKIGSYGATADGLTVDCRPGGMSYGAIGRFFDETGTGFGHADSLGAYLAGVADRLERGMNAGAVSFNGRLIWGSALAPRPDWGSADDPLPGPEEPLPPLDLPESGTDPLPVGYLLSLEELGALVAVLPRERLAETARRQLRRLATETGLAKYPETGAALDALERDEPLPAGLAGPLALRLRSVLAQSDTQRDDLRRWAAQQMAETIWSASPHRAVYGIAITRSRLSVDWRAELLADLGDPPIPPMPDDRFWGTLRNPDVNSSHCADRCAPDVSVS